MATDRIGSGRTHTLEAAKAIYQFLAVGFYIQGFGRRRSRLNRADDVGSKLSASSDLLLGLRTKCS